MVVEMRPPFADPPGGGTPILRRITWHYLEGEPQVLAAYQTSGMSLFAFLAQAGLSQLCLTPESNQCNLHIEGRIQLPLLPVILQCGSLVEIFLHGPDIDDNSYDESSLMQQPKPSRSPDLIPIRLLGLNYLNVLFYANQEEALMTQLRRSWPLPGNPVNLEAVHFVACPHTTLSSNQEHVYLLQQREDRFFQAHTNAAKEFPPSLCLAIAQSVQAFCLAQSCTEEQQSLLTWPDVPAQMWQAFHQSAGWEGGLTMGPDFWG